MPPAEPAIVDLQADVLAATKLDGESIDDDFARKGQAVLADEAEFHGREAGGGMREVGTAFGGQTVILRHAAPSSSLGG